MDRTAEPFEACNCHLLYPAKAATSGNSPDKPPF